MTKSQIAAYDAALDTELDGEPEPEEALPNSVVKGAYKTKYRQRAEAMARKPKGVPAKALRRMTGDWLAIELAKLTLDPKTAKIDVAAFEAVLDANGVAHAHWNRTTKGWQGRLRMTGRLALQRVVAEDGELVLPDGATIAAPRSWVAKHQH
jgi:predicted deacylase